MTHVPYGFDNDALEDIWLESRSFCFLCPLPLFLIKLNQGKDERAEEVLNIYKPGAVPITDFIPTPEDSCLANKRTNVKKFPAWLVTWLIFAILSAIFSE